MYKRHNIKAFCAIATVMLLPLQRVLAQYKFTTNSGYVSFFSEGSISDVDAQNNKVKVEMDISDGELTFDITMMDFQFDNGKMGRDARKKYLEIDKYLKAGFKGRIQGTIDYDKPGNYNATATGKLMIHGVEKNIVAKGSVVVVNRGQIKLKCEFNVALQDYQIETPDILGAKMTEDKALVKVEATLNKRTNADTSNE